MRAKLHAKLAEQRGTRSENNPSSSASDVSKRAARRAEKQRRQEEAKAKKKKKSALTKAEKSTNKKKFTIANADTNGTNASPATDLQNLDFGKLAGLNQTKNFINNKSLANLNKKKNLEKLLADAETKRAKLEEYKRSGDEEKATKMLWGDALKEASGDRVKDDPNKLKKKLKQRQAKKEKSQKAWKSRMGQTKEKMDDRQRIRSHNLEKRKQGGSTAANLSSKRIKDDEHVEGDAKPRRSRAGFEGLKRDFLNSGKE